MLLIPLVFALIAVPNYTQDYPKPKHPFDTSALYNSVTAIMFPLPPEPPKWGKAMLVLRFSGNGRESQINILLDNNDHYDVVQYFLPVGSSSIWDQLGKLYLEDKLSPKEDPAELAKRFRVEHRTVEVPGAILNDFLSQLSNLHFPLRDRARLGRDFVLDGNDYEFWYKEFLSRDLHIHFYQGVSHTDNAAGLEEWMNRVRSAVEAIK